MPFVGAFVLYFIFVGDNDKCHERSYIFIYMYKFFFFNKTNTDGTAKMIMQKPTVVFCMERTECRADYCYATLPDKEKGN